MPNFTMNMKSEKFRLWEAVQAKWPVFLNKKKCYQFWPCTPVIPAPRMQRQEDQEFEASVDYIGRKEGEKNVC
jgi:uncharacterized protein YbdZ (MbtH family)